MSNIILYEIIYNAQKILYHRMLILYYKVNNLHVPTYFNVIKKNRRGRERERERNQVYKNKCKFAYYFRKYRDDIPKFNLINLIIIDEVIINVIFNGLKEEERQIYSASI